jgi:hypothetical protein
MFGEAWGRGHEKGSRCAGLIECCAPELSGQRPAPSHFLNAAQLHLISNTAIKELHVFPSSRLSFCPCRVFTRRKWVPKSQDEALSVGPRTCTASRIPGP